MLFLDQNKIRILIFYHNWEKDLSKIVVYACGINSNIHWHEIVCLKIRNTYAFSPSEIS
jgi:hypothetical protein